jgi:tripartite ATP-independent transporter DctM subunit
MVAINCRKKDYSVVKKTLTAKTLWCLLKDTFLAIIAPLIIILGIILGVVTLVEVAVLSILYILLISMLVYKSITFEDIPRIFAKAGIFSTSIMIIFAVVGIYQYIVAFEQVGVQLENLIAILHLGKFEFLILANLFFLFMGCILDAVPVMLIFFPVLLPVALQLGIDATHFGVIVVINLMIGLLTPPIGALLFLEAKIADIEFEKLVGYIWPYTLSLIFVLFLCTFVPQLVTWVPNLFFK